MTFDINFFALALPAVLLAGLSKGGFGSGGAFVATPILALVLPPELAVGIMLPLLMLVDAATLKPYWRQWHWPSAKLLILGGMPGIALGAGFWTIANPDTIRLLIGLICIGFVTYQLARARGWIRFRAREQRAAVGLFAGVVSGFTSFVSHAGGPPAAIYLLSQPEMDKTRYQATTVLVFWAINIAKAVPYGFLGMFTLQSLQAGLYLAPAALLGAWIGVKAHRVIPERAFFAVTYTLLTLTGLKLIFDTVT